MSMYPNIQSDASAPSAPGFNIEFEKQPPYAPPPPYSGPPQMMQYPPPQPQVIVTQPVTNLNSTVVIDKFPSKSINIKCFFCHEDVKTTTQARANICTWLICTLLCFIGCSCGCCLIPFCTDGARDVLHYCPKCHKYLGSHERFRR